MAKIVPVVQLAMHAKSSTFYGRSYGRTVVRSYGRATKFFRLDGLLLFRTIMLRLGSRLLHMLDKTHRF